ncbi:hypothetical protein V1277_005633 [Bradyrhizobium sp. AZCC 1588]|uniref:hypothetical protein n=1 Tax=unclassified Bradyrhizobium TaxID=2631580 RepID=UPI002FF420B1
MSEIFLGEARTIVGIAMKTTMIDRAVGEVGGLATCSTLADSHSIELASESGTLMAQGGFGRESVAIAGPEVAVDRGVDVRQ